jgi:hypothetical protein
VALAARPPVVGQLQQRHRGSLPYRCVRAEESAARTGSWFVRSGMGHLRPAGVTPRLRRSDRFRPTRISDAERCARRQLTDPPAVIPTWWRAGTGQAAAAMRSDHIRHPAGRPGAGRARRSPRGRCGELSEHGPQRGTPLDSVSTARGATRSQRRPGAPLRRAGAGTGRQMEPADRGSSSPSGDRIVSPSHLRSRPCGLAAAPPGQCKGGGARSGRAAGSRPGPRGVA